jgi:hypothetical protein
MKKTFFLSAMLIAGMWQAAPAKAQIGSSILNQLVSAATSATDNSTSSETSSLISNLIASVTGSATTTQANLVGSWSYTEPAVQFESENALTKAGGTAVAAKVETKLAKCYSKVGIKSGSLKFTFDNDGNCTYGIGSNMRQGTYTFDSTNKMVNITTATGYTVAAYVTISGSSMTLTFDASKMLTLFQTISSKMSALSTVSSIASMYNGMKIGFEFSKQ